MPVSHHNLGRPWLVRFLPRKCGRLFLGLSIVHALNTFDLRIKWLNVPEGIESNFFTVAKLFRFGFVPPR
jgi:hypothetical protein